MLIRAYAHVAKPTSIYKPDLSWLTKSWLLNWGVKVLPTDDIRYNGVRITPEKKVYILLNKPKDYVTSVDDPHAKRTIMELVKGACRERIYPVGRLDRMTTGVILLTNDGDLTKKLTHPTSEIKKIYQAQLDKNLKQEDLMSIADGITLEDGFIKVDDITYLKDKDKNMVGIEIHSGKKPRCTPNLRTTGI